MDPLLIIDLLAIAGLLTAAMWIAATAGAGRRRRLEPGSGRITHDSALANAQVTVSWAAGTRSDWDRHVRPVLAREFDDIVGGRRSAVDRRATGELMFGPDLWPLVDPGGRFTTGLQRPGPGHEALSRILEKLEAA